MALFSLGVNPSQNIPTKSSDFSAWIQWHTELKNRYGLKNANAIFMAAWVKRQPTAFTTYTDPIGRHNLITYLKDNGIKLDENGIDLLTDFTYSVSDTISSAFTFGKVATYLIFGIIIIFAIIILWAFAKNPNAAIGAATSAATRR